VISAASAHTSRAFCSAAEHSAAAFSASAMAKPELPLLLVQLLGALMNTPVPLRDLLSQILEAAVAAASEDSAVARLPLNAFSSACEGGRILRNINRMATAVPIRAPLIAQKDRDN